MPTLGALHHKLGRVTEPQALFPSLTVLLLAIVWGTTAGVLKLKRGDAEHAASIATHDVLDTYESQVLRALREIDHTASLVKSWPGRESGRPILGALKAKGLLPSEMLFTVSIADRHGVIVESTQPLGTQNVARQDY